LVDILPSLKEGDSFLSEVVGREDDDWDDKDFSVEVEAVSLEAAIAICKSRHKDGVVQYGMRTTVHIYRAWQLVPLQLPEQVPENVLTGDGVQYSKE
jgi:hypothetical protein